MGGKNLNVRLFPPPSRLVINCCLNYIGPLAKSNGKEKEKLSTVSRQTTLLGMLPPKDKNKQNNPFSKKKGGGDSTNTTIAPQVDATLDAETQVVDTQVTDVMMSDAPTLVESSQSQVLDESGWEETQMIEDGDRTQVGCSFLEDGKVADKLHVDTGTVRGTGRTTIGPAACTQVFYICSERQIHIRLGTAAAKELSKFDHDLSQKMKFDLQ